jgi:hypothetical protein
VLVEGLVSADLIAMSVVDRVWGQKGLGFHRAYLSLLRERFHDIQPVGSYLVLKSIQAHPAASRNR